jgi:secondary thiamine-phosphate synthase enzyme
MGTLSEFTVKTDGERFYSITDEILVQHRLLNPEYASGSLLLYLPHTSCALCINENHEPSAMADMQNFLKHLAPLNLGFITHKTEGQDDSPSHMKSILLQTSLMFIVDKGKIILGEWQGIFLCEFRHAPKNRRVYLKFQAD